MIRKTYTVEHKAIDADAGIYEAMISTEELDRDGDIILAVGAELDNYLKNPVVLFGHQYGNADAVVGKAVEVEAMPGQGVRARWQFADADVSEHADMVRRLWAGGFLNATSIGFIPKASSEIGEENDWDTGRIYTQWELLEFSIVSVPANASALRLAIKHLEESDLASQLPPEQKSTEIEQDTVITDDTDEPEHPESDVEPIDDTTDANNANDDTEPSTEEDALLERLAEFLTEIGAALTEE